MEIEKISYLQLSISFLGILCLILNQQSQNRYLSLW